jgi:hypothetical protein
MVEVRNGIPIMGSITMVVLRVTENGKRTATIAKSACSPCPVIWWRLFEQPELSLKVGVPN